MNRRLLLTFLCMLLLTFNFCLADPLILTDDLSGTLYWPEGSNAASAQYTYSYAYPQVEENSEVAEAVNESFAYIVEDTIAFRLPMGGEGLTDPSIPAHTTVSYSVTCNNDQYFSVLVCSESSMDGFDSTIYSSHIYAHESKKAGNLITLPYLLGILNGDENDEWLQEYQTERTDECVRKLIWKHIQDQISSGEIAYRDDLDYETFSSIFYPEEDLFLSEDGSPVFYIQPGFVADESYGLLKFHFSADEILDEL